MSKLLKRLNDNQNKVADTNGILKLQAWDYGVAQDLTNKQITATVANTSGFLFDLELVSNGAEIDLDFKDSQLQKLTPDTYFLEIKVTDEAGDISVFPTEGYATFTINKNLHATEGALVPQITFDTVLADVKTAMDKKVADYVKTIAKGDKGDPGAPGKDGKDAEMPVVGGRNLIVRTGELVGKMIDIEGKVSTNDNTIVTRAIIKVTPGDPLIMSGVGTELDMNFRYAFYDEAGNTLIRNYSPLMPATTVIAPAKAATFRISYPKESQVKLERGNVATDWTPAPEDVDSATAKAQATADKATVAINNLSVGGRNLYINATQAKGYISMDGGTVLPPYGITNVMVSDYIPVLPNTQYIFQAWGSLPSGQQYWAGIGQYDANKTFLNRKPGVYDTPAVTSDVTNDYEKTMFTTDANTYFVRVSSRRFGNYKVKFERGNVATDWTLAPEDIQSDISKRAIDTSVVHNTGNETVAGNKTLTGLTTILTGNYGFRVTSSGFQKTTDGGKTWVSANL